MQPLIHDIQEFQTLLLLLVLLLWHIFSCQDFWKYEMAEGRVPSFTLKKFWWCHSHTNIPGVLITLVSLQRVVEEWWSRAIGEAVTVVDGWSRSSIWQGGNMTCSLLPRLPIFSCMAGVPTVFFGLVCISLITEWVYGTGWIKTSIFKFNPYLATFTSCEGDRLIIYFFELF